jgi:hypothetical protein
MRRTSSVLLALILSVILASPATGHNAPGNINALQPANFPGGGVYARVQYVLNGHPSYKVTAWLQQRLPGGSWSSVNSNTRISSDGYASTTPVNRLSCYDYRSIGEGWGWNSAMGYHAYAQDLTSTILFHTANC